MTKRLIELHGGTIVVTSAPGEARTFTVRLPIVSGSGPVGTHDATAAVQVRRLREPHQIPIATEEAPLILVIEDDEQTAASRPASGIASSLIRYTCTRRGGENMAVGRSAPLPCRVPGGK